MAVPNVNQITSTLRMLTDKQLQQYAQMHKGNPYIFPMAIAESNARKQVRAAGQATQGMQPQPKVADQALAQMTPQQLPEDVGIGALPAPNMTMAANGGIMGYDDGYDEGGMTYGQEPVIMMAGGGVARYQVGGATKAGPEFMRFLKQRGFDLVEFSSMDPDGKAQLVDMFEQSKSGAPSAAPAAAPATQTAQTPTGAEARKTYAPSKAAGTKATALLGKAITTGKKFTPAGLGIEALTSMGDYKTQAPDGIDTSLVGTASDLLGGEFGRAGTGLVRGLGEAAADVGSFGANMLDYVVPGKAPVSTAYEKFLADNTNLQGPRARAVANVPPAPSGGDLRGQLNRADAARFATPGVDNAPAGAAADTPSATKPSSVLSGAALSGGRAGAGTAGGASASPNKDPFSMASIKAAQKEAMGDSNYEIGAMRNQLAEFKANAEKRAQDAIDRRTKEIEGEGDVYKDRSDRLVERGKKLTAQKEENTGLAFLNAGLAMMSTPGGFAAALGKGAQVGTAQYAAGLKDLRAAQERLDEANERIEDLRMNRKDMNKRDIRALEKDRDAALADGDKMTFAFAKDMYGLNRADATAAFNAYSQGQKTVYEQDAQTKRTLATIRASTDGRTKQLWQGLMQKHGNDPVAAAKEYNAIETGDKTNVAAEKLVQDRVGEWEKANKLRLSMMKPAEQAAELRNAEKRLRTDIYTQLKLTPTMGAGASGNSGFIFRGVEPAQ